MADNNFSASSTFGFSSFASLRKSAVELSAKAAASINDIKTAAAEGGVAPLAAAPVAPDAGHEATSEGPKAPKTGENVSKQELLEILGKMNKKVKTLNLARQQLMTQLEEEQQASAALKTLVLDEILMNPPSVSASSNVSEIQKAWREKEEQDALVVQSLQQEFIRMQQEQKTDTLQDWNDWKEAKQMMMDQHAKEIAELKQQHEVQLSSLSSSNNDNVDMISKEAHKMALAQAKEAHEAMLKSFKEKIVEAQRAQTEKLRLEKDEALEKQRVALEQSWTAKLAEEMRLSDTKLQTTCDSSQQEVDNLQKQLSETLEQAAIQQKEIENIREAKQNSETELAAIQQELACTIPAPGDSSQGEVVMLKKQIAAKQKIADRVQAALNGKTQQVESLQKQLATIEALLAQKSKELDDTRVATGGQNQQLWKQLESLQKQLSDKEHVLEAKTKELGEQKRQLTKNLEALQSQLVEKEQLAFAKSKELEELEIAASNQMRKLVGKAEMLQVHVSEKEHLLSVKSQELSSQKEQLLALQNEVTKQEQLLAQTSKDMETAKAEFIEKLAQAEMSQQALANGSSEEKMNQALEAQQQSFQQKLQQLQQMNSEEIERISQENIGTIQAMEKAHEDAMSSLKSKVQALEQKMEEVNAKARDETAAIGKERDELRKKMEEYVDKMTTQFKAKLKALQERAEAESKRFETEKEAMSAKLAAKLKDMQEKAEADANRLHAEKEEINAKLSAQLRAASLSSTALKNENEELKNRLTRVKEEMQMSIENNSATATSLIEQQEVLEREKNDLEGLCQSLESENRLKSKTLEELQRKMTVLEQNLGILSEEKYEQDLKIQSNARIESKLRTSQAEVSDLREQLNKLKLEHMKNANLVARLQADKDSTERTHGERTALVAMLETQLADMNEKNAEINARMEASLYDLSQKEEIIICQQGQLQRLERELARVAEVAKKTSDSLALAQKGGDSKTSKQVESLQRELQTVRQQMAKKSAVAQKMFQERETECAELRKANKALQSEVDKGTLSDRRIFELAAKQSNRESHQVVEIEIRDRVIDNLKLALLERDGDLAFFEKHAQEVEGQVEELCRVRRREDVNLDYLKSVVVKYLSLPPGSSERARLLPVLATLLQFNNDDYQTIEEGKHKLSWWGNIAPTLIGSGGDEVSPVTTSAEVSVSFASNGNGTSNHRTSLQF